VGFSLGVGHPQKSKHDLNLWTFFPRVDVPIGENWEIEVEGNASYYDVSKTKNLYVLGLNTNILLSPFGGREENFFCWGSRFGV